MPAKILVVDDEPTLELLIRQRFRRQIRDRKLYVCLCPQWHRNPGNDALDQVCGGLCHAPASTRRTKPAPLATEGQQHLVLAGITAQSEKAMGQDAALQVVVQFVLHIGRPACGILSSLARGEKGLEMVCNHGIEHRAARIAGFVSSKSRRHACPLRTASRYGCDGKYH